MIIPRYERSQTITGDGTGARVPVNTAGAEALALVSKQLGALGNQLMAVAEKQQDDIRALEFAKIKGSIDTWFNDFYIAESENPDYEGGAKRFGEASSKYQEQALKGLKDPKLKSAVQQYLASKLPAFDLDMKKLYIAKQQDRRQALFTESAEQFIRNNDRSGLQMLVDSSPWLKDTAKQKLLSAGNVEISKNMALRDMKANLDGWTFDESLYSGLDVKEQEQLKEQHEALIYRRDRDIAREQKKVYDATDEEIFAKVFGGGRLTRMELASKVKNGQMSAESAVKWLNYFNSQAELAANRAEREASRRDRERLKKMSPLDQDIWVLSERTGTTPEAIKATYDDTMNRFLEGKMGNADLITLVETGKITSSMAQIIKATYSDLKLDPISAKYVNDSITSAKQDMRKVGIPASQINAAADRMRKISKTDIENGLFEDKLRKIMQETILSSGIPLTQSSWVFWNVNTPAGEYLEHLAGQVGAVALPQSEQGAPPSADRPPLK